MKRTHASVIALLLGAAGVSGTIAATRTAHLGASSTAPKLSQTQIVQRKRQLDRLEASLKRSLAQRPPALPAVPAVPAASAPAASTPAPGAVVASTAPLPAAAPQQVVYRRPAPIVIVKHRAGGEAEAESSGGEHEAAAADSAGGSFEGDNADD